MRLTKDDIVELNFHRKLNCHIEDEGDYYEIYVDNACGEDFSFQINKGENEVEDIIDYCYDFDVGEHFKLWYGANRGEPSDPKVLMDNCEEIEGNLSQLGEELEGMRYGIYQ